MTKPIIIVFSRDSDLASSLPATFEGRADIRACDSFEELADLTQRVEPRGFVADFRRPSGAGLVEERLLSGMQLRFPAMQIAMLTAESCPISLEQKAAESSFTHLRGRFSKDELVDAFRLLWGPAVPEVVQPPFVTEPTLSPAIQQTGGENEQAANAVSTGPLTGGDQFSDEPALGTLNGVTRRFQTNSPALRDMLAELEVAAKHDVTILLIGETGSGKTFLSRLIHEVSPRRHEPFLPVACGALPNDLIESELFGHVKGSFTSAHADKEGKFLAARRGSLLLDEIDVLGLEQQVKLLRVIETGEFEPVGSNQTQRSQARLIVASNLELQPLVERHRFRPDLYYRLNMLKFVLPPLRQRRMDIVPMAKRFIRQYAVKHAIAIHEAVPEFYEALENYPWPGNVRELEHVIQRAVIYCREGTLKPNHLPSHILGGLVGPTNDPSIQLKTSTRSAGSSLEGQVARTEREIIEQVLFKNNQSRTRTARELGISRVTLYNKMKRYGMPHKDAS